MTKYHIKDKEERARLYFLLLTCRHMKLIGHISISFAGELITKPEGFLSKGFTIRDAQR